MPAAGPVLYQPPPPGYAAEPDTGLAYDAGAVLMRNEAIDRLVKLNVNHATLAWNGQGGPVCPHAIAFLYLEQPPRSDAVMTADPAQALWRRVLAASRVVPDTPDVRGVPTLLYRLARLARERYLPAPGGFDPAVHMSIYRDDASGQAEYVGVGVSTLDSLDRPWEQQRREALDLDDIGGRVFALLHDGTAIVVDRAAARTGHGELGIHATRELNLRSNFTRRMWIRHGDISTMPTAREVWEQMYELHHVIYQQNPRPTL